MSSSTEPATYPRYVVVTGAVAAGASTLASRLADTWSAQTLLEDRIEETNPFFARAQTEPVRWGLASQVHFLTASVERHERLRALLNQPSHPVVIEDRTPFEHTGAYVEALAHEGLLPADEAALLRSLGADLAPRFLTPALLVYREMTDLQLAERVASRGRPGESAELERLTAIRTGFDSFIDSWHRGPVVRIPAEVDVLTEAGMDQVLTAIAPVWPLPTIRDRGTTR